MMHKINDDLNPPLTHEEKVNVKAYEFRNNKRDAKINRQEEQANFKDSDSFITVEANDKLLGMRKE